MKDNIFVKLNRNHVDSCAEKNGLVAKKVSKVEEIKDLTIQMKEFADNLAIEKMTVPPKEIWKEALGSALGGGAGAGAYAFGIIAGGPAIVLGGFLAFVGWKTGSYFSNDKEKTD